MIILGIETTSKQGSVALLKDGELLCEKVLAYPLRHSNYIIASIDDVMKSAGMPLSVVDTVAVGVGPGSFTGIRVGIAIAKGLNCDGKLRVVGVSSLQNIADQVDAQTVIYPMVYAQRDEFFVQKYQKRSDNSVVADGECMILKPEVFNSMLEKTSVICTPDLDRLVKFGSLIDTDMLPDPVFPMASSTARIACFQSDEKSEDINPVYIRRAEAEVKGAKIYKF